MQNPFGFFMYDKTNIDYVLRREIYVCCLSRSWYIIKSAIKLSNISNEISNVLKCLKLHVYLRLYHNPCWPLYSLNTLSRLLSLYQVKCHQQFQVAPILNESKCSINMCHEPLNMNVF